MMWLLIVTFVSALMYTWWPKIAIRNRARAAEERPQKQVPLGVVCMNLQGGRGSDRAPIGFTLNVEYKVYYE
jgi:hypothetical protein